jgi:hypothetical protein
MKHWLSPNLLYLDLIGIILFFTLTIIYPHELQKQIKLSAWIFIRSFFLSFKLDGSYLMTLIYSFAIEDISKPEGRMCSVVHTKYATIIQLTSEYADISIQFIWVHYIPHMNALPFLNKSLE